MSEACEPEQCYPCVRSLVRMALELAADAAAHPRHFSHEWKDQRKKDLIS